MFALSAFGTAFAPDFFVFNAARMTGVLAAQIVNLLISKLDTELIANQTLQMIRESWSGQFGWRWMFGAEAVPALIFFFLMFTVPESVRWLVKDGQEEKA